MSSPSIGVVTVLYNSSKVLRDFFASLRCQSVLNFHVWAIDNASTDDSATLCLSQGEIFTVLANTENLGVAAGNNQGIRAALAAGCEYVLLLNNDVVFGPELFQKLLTGLTTQVCDMVAPVMCYHDRPSIIWAAGGRFQPLYGYRCYHMHEGVEYAGRFSQPLRIQHSPTCCVLLKRSVFQVVGLMDERYFVYHDDTDFMLRCWKAGKRLFLLPDAKLLHKVSSLTGGAESDFSVHMGTRNRAYLLSKFVGRAIALPYILALWLTYETRHILGRSSRERLAMKKLSLREGFEMASNWLPYHHSQQRNSHDLLP